MTTPIAVHLERGPRKTFAAAIDWPGWSRSGTSEGQAITSLLGYAGRYRAALATGGVERSFPSADDSLVAEVVERSEGSHGTDFGVPSRPPSADARPLPPDEAGDLVAILRASWLTFDMAVDAAEGHELRLGPRGGGRDLERIIAHLREADAAYLAQLGVRPPRIPGVDAEVIERAIRSRAAEVVMAIAAGEPLEDANKVAKTWTPRAYVRRAAWHALDHAWELEDRRID